MQAINFYKKELANLKSVNMNLSESSYRTTFENLLNGFAKEIKSDVKIFQEIAKKTPTSGAGGLIIPDFTCISANNLGTVGFVETKDAGFDIENYVESEQIKKYRVVCDNILLTNYTQFIWLNADKKQITNLDSEQELITLLRNFLAQEPEKIQDTKKLAEYLARYSKDLKGELLQELLKSVADRESEKTVLFGIYQVFLASLFKISYTEFADAFAQMTAFGFMIAKLNNPDEVITLHNVRKSIPTSFGLIKELLRYVEDITDKKTNAELYVSQLLGLMNNMEVETIERELFTRKQQIVNLYGQEHTQYIDPFVYFYEDYLGSYDKDLRKAKGVYYTPMPVVQLIIRLIDKGLQENFNLTKGIADKNVNTLDFACGTGTFMVEYAAQALNKQSKDLQKPAIQQRLLPNLYGFEYLAAPYTVAILKLSQFLKKNYDYNLVENDKINIKLTNTLDSENLLQRNALFPNISQEMNDADFIKKQNILVVMGNPPYSVSSSNKNDYITKLVNDYKSAKNTVDRDKSVNALSDDYVKFIRFAHDKISKQNKGMIGIITNNSYLDGIVHKTMREKLLQDFDKIYIINLHGNSLRKEGDKNVFDIRVGVCITLFIKLENRLAADKKEVFYYSTLENDLISREQKFEFTEKIYEKLATNDIYNSLTWTKLSPQTPHFFFVPKDLSQQKEYDKFWSLKDIFVEWNSGIKTHRDKLVIDTDKNRLQQKIIKFYQNNKEIIKNYDVKNTGSWKMEEALKNGKFDEKHTTEINYRIFDRRFIQYDTYLVERSRNEIMQYFLRGKNIGLVTIRKSRSVKTWKHIFVSDTLISEGTTLGTLDNCYIFPLYCYDEEMGEKGKKKINKVENFTKDFRKFINEIYGKSITPEQIFGYIYAVLYSPAYREQYNELLQIDFPRIPFDKSLQEFENIAKSGWELAQMHLLQNVPNLEIADFVGENRKVMKVFWQNEKLYINPVSYFSGVSKAVFDYEIGAYQVLHKYLKDRNEEILSLDEIEHLQNVIKVLAKTVEFGK